MIQRAFPVLKLEYDEYWNGVEHSTPIGPRNLFRFWRSGAIRGTRGRRRADLRLDANLRADTCVSACP